MAGSLQNVGLFLIGVIFDLYIFVLMLRFLLQCVEADYHNPIVQFVVKLTRWLIAPLAKIIPRYKGVDWFILILILILEIVKLTLLYVLHPVSIPTLSAIILVSIFYIVNKFLNFYFYSIIFRAILSWMISAKVSALSIVLHQLTEPLLKPFRRIIPPIAGFDLSPIIVLILLIIISILLMHFMLDFNTKTIYP